MLARAAESFGVEIRLESPVEHVITANGRATGVALADGTEFHAPIVVSALDPRRTFLELVEPRELPTDLVDTIERFRFQGTSAKVNFALDGVPRYPALGDRTDQYRGFTNIGPSMEYLERAYDDAKYGWYSKKPYLDCAIQSMVDPDMAPPGKAVMSCFVQYAPYHLRGSDWDTEKEGLGDTVQATLESFFPGFGDLVLQREIRTPLDIERTVGLSEGNIFAGEFLAPADVLLPAGPRLEPVRHADRRLLPVRVGDASRRLRHGRARQAGGAADPQGPGGVPAEVRVAPTLMLVPGQGSARPARRFSDGSKQAKRVGWWALRRGSDARRQMVSLSRNQSTTASGGVVLRRGRAEPWRRRRGPGSKQRTPMISRGGQQKQSLLRGRRKRH